MRSLSLSRSGFAVDAIFAGLKFQSSIAGFTNSISAVTAWAAQLALHTLRSADTFTPSTSHAALLILI